MTDTVAISDVTEFPDAAGTCVVGGLVVGGAWEDEPAAVAEFEQRTGGASGEPIADCP